MELFKKKEQINNNEPLEVEQTKKEKSFLQKVKIFFFIWNIFSLSVYTVFTLHSLYKNAKSTIFSKIILILLIAYAVAFVCLIAFGIRNKVTFKANVKNYKSAMKILKQFIKILNLTLAFVTAISIFLSGNGFNVSAIVFGALSIFIAIGSIMFEIIKMIIRKKLAKHKEEKLKRKANALEVSKTQLIKNNAKEFEDVDN